MKIYLAARYSRRLELCEYRKQIELAGHIVTSRWLNGSHQISNEETPIGDHGERLVEGDDGSSTHCAAALRQQFAIEDYNDVLNCELLIAFTEPPRSGHSRGGRHVELGVALGRCTPIAIVGHRENIFCWLDVVEFFETWQQLMSVKFFSKLHQ